MLPKVYKCSDVKRDDLRLSLPTQQTNIKNKFSTSLRNTMNTMPMINRLVLLVKVNNVLYIKTIYQNNTVLYIRGV